MKYSRYFCDICERESSHLFGMAVIVHKEYVPEDQERLVDSKHWGDYETFEVCEDCLGKGTVTTHRYLNIKTNRLKDFLRKIGFLK